MDSIELSGTRSDQQIVIREAVQEDHDFVVDLINDALNPYYGGDHVAHSERIFKTHVEGGVDLIGHFSTEQKMFIAMSEDERLGIVHLVGKRQGNHKISPLIVVPEFRSKSGVGRRLLDHAESYAREKGSRQIYCTVAESNAEALKFFLRNGYIVAGRSESHYMTGVVELMLYKQLTLSPGEPRDIPSISVVPFEPVFENQVRRLLLESLSPHFIGIDDAWVDSLFAGYHRRNTNDVNMKFKVLFVAIDRDEKVLGVVGATPKKGQPIKLMPFVATTDATFLAFLVDLPFQLKEFGRKIYAHLAPTADQVQSLQEYGWTLDAAMPMAYHEKGITYQWSLNLMDKNVRTIRVKDHILAMIRDGRKTLEVRVLYDNISKIKRDDILNLTSFKNEQLVRVLGVRRYETFNLMLQNEKAERILPGYTEQQTFSLLTNLYPPKKESLGVVVFEIECLSSIH